MRFFLSIILFLQFVFCFSVAGQPNAHIVSTPYGICNRDLATVDVLMSGEAPFGLQYKISYQKSTDYVIYTSELLYPDLNMTTQFQHLVGNNQDDKAVIQLLKVRDKSMAENEWLDLATSEVILFPTFQMPVGYINLPGNNCGYFAALSARDNGLIDPSYQWESLSGGIFSSVDGRTTSFTAQDAGKYTIRLIEKNGVCQATTQSELTILGYPKGNIAGSTIICTAPENNDLKRLEAAVTLSGTAPFHYVLSDGTKRSTNLASETIVLQPNKGGDIVFAAITDGNGCEARAQDRTGAAVVLDRLPTASAGADVQVCDSIAVLNAVINKVGNLGQWQFVNTADGTFLTESQLEAARIKTTRNGSVELRWSEINMEGSACPSHDFVKVRFDLPIQAVSAGTDTTLYLETSFRMRATIKPWEAGQWSLVSGSGDIATVTDPQTDVTNLVFGRHNFRWTVSNGICPMVSADLFVEVKGLNWPNGFSPNGDGVNDYLVIQGAPNVKNSELIVYDQKGKVVYRKSDYKNSWDGKDMDNRDLPDGFYYYVFSGDLMSPVKETLVIKRSKF